MNQTPVRIQRSRRAGWRMPENAIYVGRPTKWGNPFKVGQMLTHYPDGRPLPVPFVADMGDVVRFYASWLKSNPDSPLKDIEESIERLRAAVKRAGAFERPVDIDAAHDLLEAARDALAFFEGQWSEVGYHPASHWRAYVEDLQAVIAKARGEQ